MVQIRGTRGALYFLISSIIFGYYCLTYIIYTLAHDGNATYTRTNVRVQTVVLPRRCLLALLSFVWFCLVCGLCCVVVFGPSVFSLSSRMLCTPSAGSSPAPASIQVKRIAKGDTFPTSDAFRVGFERNMLVESHQMKAAFHQHAALGGNPEFFRGRERVWRP